MQQNNNPRNDNIHIYETIALFISWLFSLIMRPNGYEYHNKRVYAPGSLFCTKYVQPHNISSVYFRYGLGEQCAPLRELKGGIAHARFLVSVGYTHIYIYRCFLCDKLFGKYFDFARIRNDRFGFNYISPLVSCYRFHSNELSLIFSVISDFKWNPNRSAGRVNAHIASKLTSS